MMATPAVPFHVVLITCTHCNQEQNVQVRAHHLSFAQANPKTVRCVKCEQDFDAVGIPDDIVGGPFLP